MAALAVCPYLTARARVGDDDDSGLAAVGAAMDIVDRLCESFAGMVRGHGVMITVFPTAVMNTPEVSEKRAAAQPQLFPIAYCENPANGVRY